ncbi:diacylglycerol/lipid kinase family protein [Leucobacter sp. M11]|uniref:diacylglycerol/lipid kinase family protein n=1 Tax=Leucobacter sp. M11 TaxID=2993565 RepID=UPI002D805FEB|nr:diacylglycerol kinase family protein [Leucobacter sp. M11]MEB4614642.1 diacylglycerol kinase family protein [Leucobacter sp. M11]
MHDALEPDDSIIGLVWNPSKTSQGDLEAAIPATPGLRFSWFETSADDPGRAATQQALDAGATLILAAGGDGTVRAVAEHLADTGGSADLGIVPLGTGNLLARNLGVPLNDPAAAIAHALGHAGTPLDIGWAELTLDGGVERHAFAVMAGFGIDAHMITETDDDLKDRAGWLAYVESLGRAVSASELIPVTLSADGGEPVTEPAHTLLVGNCGTLQGGLTLLPDADPRDGELDLLVLNAEGIGGWADTVRNLLWDNGLKRLFAGSADATAASSESASHSRVRTLTVDLGEPRQVEVDGDALGEASRIVLSVQPGAIRVRAAEPDSAARPAGRRGSA